MHKLDAGKAYLKVCGKGRHYPDCPKFKRNKHGCALCSDIVLKSSKGDIVR